MRFLCISDTHGVLPDGLPEGRFDAILHAGDVGGVHALRQLERMSQTGRLPLIYVLGNHDAGISAESASDLTGRAVKIADRLVIAGIGCAANVGLLPTDADIGNACAQTIAATKAVVRKNDHILLLSHYPPVLEETEAYASVSPDIFSLDVGDVLRKLEPVALVHGHSHFLQLHQERWRGTMVACAGPDWGLLTVDVERGHTTYSPWVGA